GQGRQLRRPLVRVRVTHRKASPEPGGARPTACRSPTRRTANPASPHPHTAPGRRDVGAQAGGEAGDAHSRVARGRGRAARARGARGGGAGGPHPRPRRGGGGGRGGGPGRAARRERRAAQGGEGGGARGGDPAPGSGVFRGGDEVKPRRWDFVSAH